MKRQEGDREHDELTRLLREEDPAGDGSDPSPEEIARMRRSIVEASHDARPAWLAVPALALATILALAVAAWLLPRPDGVGPPVSPSGPPSVPGTTVPETVAEALPDEPEATLDEPVPPDTVKVAQGPPPPDPVPATATGSPTEEPVSRTVRFTTPNGTRIVWVLNPNLDI